MSIAKRKIGFYSLIVNDLSTPSHMVSDPIIIKDVIDYIVNLDKSDRVYDLFKNHKFHLIDYALFEGGAHKLIFKSGKYYHRPPLIDKESASERDNPKTLNEGESEKTHIVIKYKDREAILIKEDRRSGISIGNVIEYLSHYLWLMRRDIDDKIKYSISFNIIAKDNFLKELNNLNRAMAGEIFMDRKLLGSPFLNLSSRTEEVQETLQLIIKAKKKKSIKETLIEIYHKFAANSSNIEKIRIHGLNAKGDSILLDTDLIKKIEYISTGIDEATGIVESNAFIDRLASIMDGL
jgi:hypothetical protein